MTAQTADKFAFTPWNATRFFVPLFLQAASQSLTYPLVGVVVAHGLHGAREFSAFSQGFMLMFLIGTLGFGLVTTGMVYAKDRLGYLRFRRVNALVMVIISLLQCALALPVIAPFVFGKLLGLEGVQLEIARWSMLFGLPAQLAFLLRNVPQVLLYNDHATGLANMATILRIILTAILAPIFHLLGLVGWVWGCVCLTIPVFLESFLMDWFARPYLKRLPMILRDGEKASVTRIFLFNIPLSLGGTLLSLSVFMLNAIINRTENGASMLAVHLVSIGLINPVSFGALRNQAVAIGFPQRDLHDQRTFLFAIATGIVLAALLLPLTIPAVGDWYFCAIQNLSPHEGDLARQVIWWAIPFLLFQAVRGHAEGLAAYRHRPNAVLAGQAVFFGVLVSVLVTLFHFDAPSSPSASASPSPGSKTTPTSPKAPPPPTPPPGLTVKGPFPTFGQHLRVSPRPLILYNLRKKPTLPPTVRFPTSPLQEFTQQP